MYKIEAIIRPNRLDDVQDALDDLHISGMTVTEVRGMGKQKGVTHTYRGSQYTMSLSPKIQLSLVVHDNELETVLETIRSTAATGEVGDGKIFYWPIEGAVRIRTGERGDTALS